MLWLKYDFVFDYIFYAMSGGAINSSTKISYINRLSSCSLRLFHLCQCHQESDFYMLLIVIRRISQHIIIIIVGSIYVALFMHLFIKQISGCIIPLRIAIQS